MGKRHTAEEIVAKLRQVSSKLAIANELNRLGVKTSRRGSWTSTAVRVARRQSQSFEKIGGLHCKDIELPFPVNIKSLLLGEIFSIAAR